jgi:large-conductance mechanosensitive channel
VKLFISKSEKETIEATVKTDDQGNWSYFHRGSLAKGNYEVWAKIIDNRGAESSNSARHLMSVVSPSLVAAYGFYIIIILLLIIVALIVYIFYQRKKFEEEKRRIKAETDEVKDKLRKVFVALREEVDELIEMSDKEPGLSEAERRIKEKLQESLDISEEFITKEVDDVEKEIK